MHQDCHTLVLPVRRVGGGFSGSHCGTFLCHVRGGGSTKKRKIFEILFFFTKLAKIEWNIIRNS